MCVKPLNFALDRSASHRHFAGTGTGPNPASWPLSEARRILGNMRKDARITRFDGAVLADALFLIGQAWVRGETGDTDGAAADLAAAMKLIPPDTVEAIHHFIEVGTLPEPSS